MNWYYSQNNQAIGPMELHEILPQINSQTLVWCEGSIENWVEANAHPLLSPIFSMNMAPVESREMELKSPTAEEIEAVALPNKDICFEVTLTLKVDWTTKGIGKRGNCYLYFENKFVNTLSLDGFEIKFLSKNEELDLKFLSDLIEESEIAKQLNDDFLLELKEFYDIKLNALKIPKLDGTKNHKITLEYGSINNSFFAPDYGIKLEPLSILSY